MKAKQKAEDLLDKMYYSQSRKHAKQCALIAVDEIILSHNKEKEPIDIEMFSYWQDVQIEILKL